MADELKPTLTGKIKTEEILKDFMPNLVQIKENLALLLEIAPFPMINYLSATKYNGYLVVSGGEKIFEVFFQWGTILSVTIREKIFEEGIAEMLIKAGLLTLDGFTTAKTGAQQTGKGVLQVLYEMGLVPPKNLMTAIKHYKEDLLTKLLDLTEGTYSTYENAKFAGPPDPVRIETGIFLVNYMKDKTKAAFFKDLEPQIQFLYGRYPVKTPFYEHMMGFIVDSPKEQRAIDEIMDGSKTLKELFSLSILSRHRTARLFYILTAMNLLEYRTIPIPKGGIEEYEKELCHKVERTRAEDLFLRMNLHWTSHPDEIQPAYEKMVQFYGPDSSIRKLSPAITELADQIFELMNESYRTLSSLSTRRKYKEDLLGNTKMEFGLDFLIKQANLAFFRGNIELAKRLVEAAIDCRPKDEYYSLLNKFKADI